MQTEKQQNNTVEEKKGNYDGVVIGVLAGFNQQQQPLVAYAGNPQETALVARSATPLVTDDAGREVALMFESGDPRQPLIIGLIQHPENQRVDKQHETIQAEVDDDHLILTAKQDITLKCGKASITLTKAGKVILRGAYLLSRSSGVNRIKGGSIQLN